MEESLCWQAIGILFYLVEKGKQLGYRFSVTSNGYDVDHYLDYIRENRIFSFQITLDGVADIHNRRKPHFKNADSFEKISSNIDSLLKLGIPVSVRINTDTYTMGRITELLNFFKEKGWYAYKHFSAYTALMRKEIGMKEDGLPVPESNFTQSEFCRAYHERNLPSLSGGKVKCQDYHTYPYLMRLLSGKTLDYKSCFCGAQSGMIIFDPLGDIYSCWDVVGIRNMRIGKYLPEFKIDEELSKRWFNARLSETNCAMCKYVFFCGGGCPALTYRSKGEARPGACNDFPRLFNFQVQYVYDKHIKANMYEK